MTPRNRVMNPWEDLTAPEYRAVVDDIHDMMASNHRYRPHALGAPCFGSGTFIHGTKHAEYPMALELAGLLAVPKEQRHTVHVLDVGSWGSAFPPYLCRLGYQVTAMDVQAMPMGRGLYQECIEVGQLRCVVQDITQPPVLADRFPVITCICVLEHIRHHVTALKRMRDYLAPGGRLILTIEYTPPGVYMGSRRAWPKDTMQFNEDTVPLMLEEAGLEPVGPVDYKPPVPWPEYQAAISQHFPDSAPVGVLALCLAAKR